MLHSKSLYFYNISIQFTLSHKKSTSHQWHPIPPALTLLYTYIPSSNTTYRVDLLPYTLLPFAAHTLHFMISWSPKWQTKHISSKHVAWLHFWEGKKMVIEHMLYSSLFSFKNIYIPTNTEGIRGFGTGKWIWNTKSNSIFFFLRRGVWGRTWIQLFDILQLEIDGSSWHHNIIIQL